MRKLVVFTLFLVLTFVGISSLSAGVSPNSPNYDAWKKAQVNTPEVTVKPTQPSQNFQIVDNQDKDQCELLIPLDGTFTTALGPNDDYYTGQIDLPFVFSLYGLNYNYCFINNNGNITFDYGYSSYTPWGFPISGSPMVAPFFADVDTRGTGGLYYRIQANNMVVLWDHVGYYSYGTDKVNTFELIISDGTYATIGLGNNVAFSYADMAWTTGSASGGSGGFGGSPATVGINKSDGVYYAQIGRFDHAGTDYDGPYDLNDGVDWLDCQLFLFNTGGYASNVNPIFVATPPDPVNLYVGGTWNFTATIVSPEAGQTTNAVVVHGMPEGMSYVVTPGNTCTVAFTVTATVGNMGTWPISITATDDGTPNLSSTDDFDIVITPAPSGFTYSVTSHDVMNPSDPDLNAEILYCADPDGIPVSFSPPIFCPYTFGITGNHPFVTGRYAVMKECWDYWIPESVSFIAITTSYANDFLGMWICQQTPVELSSFSATLTAQKYVQLSWVSQSETNMMGYRVYRNETNDQSTSLMITPVLVPATNTSEQQTYTVTDNEVTLGQVYYYWLESVDVASSQFFGPLSIIVEGEVPPVIPEISSMKSAYPNPFKADRSTSIEVALKGGETGTVTIYNVAGQSVRTFNVTEGTHTITWNGMDSKGQACSSGIYFYKLSTPSINQTKKMVIIK